jgi:hypothetical protein
MNSKYLSNQLEDIRLIGINQSIPELCHIVNQIIIHRKEIEHKWSFFVFAIGFGFGTAWSLFIFLLIGG